MTIIIVLAGFISFLLIDMIMQWVLGSYTEGHLGIYYSQIKGEEIKEAVSFLKRPKKNKNIKMDARTYIRYAFPMAAGIFGFCILFLRSIPLAMIFSLGGLLYPGTLIRNKIRKRKEILNIQLKDALLSISNSLKAGASLQTAIERSSEDVGRVLKMQIEKPMLEELEAIMYDLHIGKTLEEALISFRKRAQLEDVDIFVNAAIITKEKGGNLTEVMSNVSESISDKIQIKREIMTLTAGKRAEAKLLTSMPVLLVLTLSFLSPSYMRPMYETALGKTMMVSGLLLLLANYIIGKKIININI